MGQAVQAVPQLPSQQQQQNRRLHFYLLMQTLQGETSLSASPGQPNYKQQ